MKYLLALCFITSPLAAQEKETPRETVPAEVYYDAVEDCFFMRVSGHLYRIGWVVHSSKCECPDYWD